MSQLIKALGVLVSLALLLSGASEIKKGARGQQAPGQRATSKNVTLSNNDYTTDLHKLASQALAQYFRTQNNRHLKIYKAIAQLIGGSDDTE